MRTGLRRREERVLQNKYEDDYGECPSKPTSQSRFFFLAGSTTPVQNTPGPNQGIPVVPENIKFIKYNPLYWSSRRQPWNYVGSTWPPTSAASLLNTNIDMSMLPKTKSCNNLVEKHGGLKDTSDLCLGKYCWQTQNWSTKYLCPKAFDNEAVCDHTFDEWLRGCSDWESRFEIREISPSIGAGVFSTHFWQPGDVLGAYLGELILKPRETTDYCHEVTIGPEFEDREAETAYIDSAQYGNWTRFCNHSCGNNAEIKQAKVGNTRVLALVAVKTILPNEQVCIDYKADYFRNRWCLCGAPGCKYANPNAEKPVSQKQDCITTLLPEYLPTESGLPTATYFLDTIRCMRTSFYEWQVNCTRGPRDPMDYYIAVGEVLDKYESLVYQGTVDWDNFCLDLDEVEKGNWSGSKSHGMRLDRYFAEDDAMEDVELSSRGKSRAWKVKAEGMDKDCAPGSAKRKRTKT